MKPWKVRKFAEDVVYDLRNRGLFPLAILLVLAMVAFPFLITQMGGDDPVPSSPPPAESAADLAPENQAAVVAYNPGVRDYKERLGEMQSKNPFVQQFTAPPVQATALEQSGLETGATAVPSGDTGGSSVTTAPGGGGDTSIDTGPASPAPSGGGKVVRRYYYFETDVLVGEEGTTLTRRNRVQIFDYLPSPTLPVLSFMGYADQGKRAVFLVSRGVIGFDGPGSCFPSPEDCQLLSLRAGESQGLTYVPEGAEPKVVRIEVLRIRLRTSSKPPRG